MASLPPVVSVLTEHIFSVGGASTEGGKIIVPNKYPNGIRN